MLHSLLPRLLLIVALLFAQMGGVTHGISHALGEQPTKHAPDQSQAGDKHCDLCEVYAQIGSAVGASSQPMLTASSQETPHLTPRVTASGNVYIAYPARAPPYSA